MNQQVQGHNDISSEEAELCRQIEEAVREQELCVERRTALQAAIAAKTSSEPETGVASAAASLSSRNANGTEHEQREIEQLNEKCRSLHDLLKLWRGQQLLHRLTRNDPETALVDSFKLPHGHGQSLGAALQHNTVVQALDLNLWQAFPPNEDESNSNSSDGSDANFPQWSPLLNFLQTSTSLINLRVVKGGLPISSQDTWNLCCFILNVLANNEHLEKLSWDALCYPNALVKLLANSRSALRDLNMVFSRQIPELEQQVIASAFGATQQEHGACHLQSLQLEVDGREALVVRILTNLQHHVPTLRRLALKGRDNIYFEAPHDEDDVDNPERNAVFDALSQYLQSPTCALDRFELGIFTMGQSNMSKILSGLKRTTTSSSDRTRGSVFTTTTLSVLVFMDITFDDAAFDELTAFLQTRTTNGNGEIVYESNLRELHIEFMEGSPLPSRMSKQLAISMLTAVDTDLNEDGGGSGEAPSKSRTVDLPTVGSQIHTLRLSYAHSSFCRHLGQNADRVRLKELQVFSVDGSDTRHLSKCLSRLSYLPKLTVRAVYCRTARRLILHGLKNNGSIGDFSAARTSWESPMLDQSLHPLVGYSSDGEEYEEYDKFNESESRLIAAYGYRNKVLGTLLETGRYETTAVAALDDGDGHQVSSNNDKCTAACTSPFGQAGPISVSGIHYPLLMKTTMDVPRSCLGMVTRGLLKLDETIGQDGSAFVVRRQTKSVRMRLGAYFCSSLTTVMPIGL